MVSDYILGGTHKPLPPTRWEIRLNGCEVRLLKGWLVNPYKNKL